MLTSVSDIIKKGVDIMNNNLNLLYKRIEKLEAEEKILKAAGDTYKLNENLKRQLRAWIRINKLESK